MIDPRFECAGESALIVYLAEAPSPELSGTLQALSAALREALAGRIIDIIPAFTSLLVIFDGLHCDHETVETSIGRCLANVRRQAPPDGATLDIPTFYHPDCGEDLERLASARAMDWEEFAQLHQSREYRVYAVGFAPGFAYLGDLDPRLAEPRLATPRKQVPAGRVAIAERQTAVYPSASPGGWNLIGASPLRLFDAGERAPRALAVGDRVRFSAISRADYLDAGGTL